VKEDFKHKKYLKNIAGAVLLAMFFSCTNSSEEVKDFFADKNLPMGYAENVAHVYKDSGRVSSKMETPILLDFSNRKMNPYNEFPKGILITSFKNQGNDSIGVWGDYAITYSNTSLSKIEGNVVVLNYLDGSRLETTELYWDDKSNYFFTEKRFTLAQDDGIIEGFGFESNQDLSDWIMKRVSGDGIIKEE